ncbi:RING-6 protein [Boeremia exigua]|uniref:RING-6 protein n=1 Tax=Boeremia exigua TaxID=749465 RepID=UPI001E8D6FA6|nr:RING-6 protein [Boeremia exigua]KAH6639559.1 RING-6 protein [Boeremia exigua]
MTKKRKRYPDLNQKLERPWCFYCERDFDDLKILISHQKAKHFKCDRCGRRLNTAGGLSVHMNQVHKENLTHVENAIGGRQGLDIEIFGMEGVPAEILDQHNQQVTQKHFAEEAERARVTGNPVRGEYANGQAPPNTRKKISESLDEIEARAAKYRHDRQNGILPAPVEVVAPPNPVRTAAATSRITSLTAQTPPAASYGAPPAPFAAPVYQPPQGFPTNGAIPPRPGSLPGQPAALPPRPGAGAPATLDDGGAGEPVGERKEDKKSKKSANIKLVFFDDFVSPEEKMARLPRFAVAGGA